MMRPTLILSPLLLALSVGATAQTDPVGTVVKPTVMDLPACAASAPLPASYATFANPAPAAQGSGVFLGHAAALDLGPGTHFVVPPEHAPAAGTFGGMVGFDVIDPGAYQVATGSAIWVDVIGSGAAIRSTGHERGPACTVVRKIVDFTLKPGHYTLQLSGSAMPNITFQVAKAF